MTETTITHCANHPAVETSLRCNRCEKYICVKCAHRMPTGYRCSECVRQQQKKFDTAGFGDYLLAFILGGFLSFLGGIAMLAITSVIWGYVVIFLGPVAGTLIGDTTRRVIRSHGKTLNYIFLAGIVIGPLPILGFFGLGGMILALFVGQFDPMSILSLFSPVIFQIIYMVLAVPTAYARFSGIQLFR